MWTRSIAALVLALLTAGCSTSLGSDGGTGATGVTVTQPTAAPATPESRPATSTTPTSAPGPTDAGTFTLTSPAVAADGALPAAFTCDGEGATPPLEWSGAPEGTGAYALVMHHVPPDGDTHWYWVVYGLDATVSGLEANADVPGRVGTNSVNGRTEYAPPCSQGPGEKVYTFTLYALSAQPDLPDPGVVTREALLEAIDGLTLGQAGLEVSYDRTGTTSP